MKSLLPSLAFALLTTATLLSADETQVIDAKRHHLGLDGEREWRDLDGTQPEGQSLQLTFRARANTEPATLYIRQRDVKLKWPVLLNGRRLGTLDPIETAQVTTLSIPPGMLRDGENSLSILSLERPDDIYIEEIVFDQRPPEVATRDGVVAVRVTDAKSGAPAPCRITIVDDRGALAAVTAEPGQQLALRSGVVYTGTGSARFCLRSGAYTIYANRGFEYGVAQKKITVRPGSSAEIGLQIEREVDTAGFAACDPHVHTFTYSKHGDVTAEERVLTLAGEGIELAIAADHNIHADYSDAARELGVAQHFTYVIGNEVTTPAGHFIAFPVASAATAVPEVKLTDWSELNQVVRSIPNVQVMILNHPRDMHSRFVPFAPEHFNPVTGDNLRGGLFDFDAIEVCNSGALQSDFMRGFRDWFALLNQGYRITAVAASDSHDVSRSIVGQGRTYIAIDDADPGKLDVDLACKNLKAGRAGVSLGLYVRLTVDDRFGMGDLAPVSRETVKVKAEVLGPSWVQADRLELFANGVKIREEALAPQPRGGTKASLEWTLPRFDYDVHLVAIASGPRVTAPYWEIQTPYQPTDRVRNPRVIGATNPVWIDGDGDGRFSSARLYAEKIAGHAGSDLRKCMEELAGYDEAVAAQVAGLCHDAGLDLKSPPFTEALRAAPAQVRRGFEAYLATMVP